MRRRNFIALVGGAAAAWPLAARATQTEQMRRIGVLMGYPDTDSEGQAGVAAFQEGLQQFGWSSVDKVRIDTRWAPPGNSQALHRFAKEIVTLQPGLRVAERRHGHRVQAHPLSAIDVPR
jgi:putative ABC transport system substrate-binding protein